MGLNDRPAFVLVFALLVASAAVFYTWMFARLWRGDPKVVSRFILSASAFTDDDNKQRAAVRGSGGICVAIWGLAIGLIGVSIDALGIAGRASSWIFWVATLSGLGLLIAGVTLEQIVIARGRPLFIIPPSLRVEAE